jgi:deoxyribodipyrimidine photo-lyase
MKEKLIVYWSRRDFRLRDNPALYRALEHSRSQQLPLLPLFILEDYMCTGDPREQFGVSSRWFLSHALPAFAEQFRQFALVRGTVLRTFDKLTRQFDLTIYVNEDVHPDFYSQIKKLAARNIALHLVKDQMTIDRTTITGAKTHYSIFTPFKRAVWKEFIMTTETPSSNPDDALILTDTQLSLIPHRIEVDTTSIEKEFSSNRTFCVGGHTIDLAGRAPLPVLDDWYTSEHRALEQFAWYLTSDGLYAFKDQRDSLEEDAHDGVTNISGFAGKTSRMSLALTWGLVSARTLKTMVQQHFNTTFERLDDASTGHVGALSFLSELVWREFYKYLLYHNPRLLSEEFQVKYRGTIAWAPDDLAMERFLAWIEGKTGYPIVDAAMKQLAATGWMHNRARMIVASVLTKNFGVDWRWGQEYFRAVLIDLDEASNNGGWQWGASVGADPKPIRIFNAELQAKTHDTSGRYQKKWLGVGRFENPIAPIIPHVQARAEALRRYRIGVDASRRDY